MDLQNVREALITAIDAMCERRGYSEAFEYKYKEQWDEDDKIVREALAELEKQADEEAKALDVAIKINDECIESGWEGHLFNRSTAADIIQQYAEAYHARKLAIAVKALESASIGLSVRDGDYETLSLIRQALKEMQG